MLPESVKNRLAEIVAKSRAKLKRRDRLLPTIGDLKECLHANKGHARHRACAARATGAKNTHANPLNIRGSKSRRPESRFQKLRAFKSAYGII